MDATETQELEPFREWLLCNFHGTLRLFASMMCVYLFTLLAKDFKLLRSTHEDRPLESPPFQFSTYALLGTTFILFWALMRKNVQMVRASFFVFGVLHAAVTLQVGMETSQPVPRMLEIESRLFLEFISNIVVVPQLICADLRPIPRLLFVGMHIASLVPFYMRVIAYSLPASIFRALCVHAINYSVYAAIKHRADSCYQLHQQRKQQAERAAAATQARALNSPGPSTTRVLSPQPGSPHHPPPHSAPLPHLASASTQPKPSTQLHHTPTSRTTLQSAWSAFVSLLRGGGHPFGPYTPGDNTRMDAQQQDATIVKLQPRVVCTSMSKRLCVQPTMRRTQVHIKIHGDVQPEDLDLRASEGLRGLLHSWLPALHLLSAATRKGSLILSLDLFEPIAPEVIPGHGQALSIAQHSTPQQQAADAEEREAQLCHRVLAAVLEWCSDAGLPRNLAHGTLLTMQVNQMLRSCEWDASQRTWASHCAPCKQLDHDRYSLALSAPTLFMPHVPRVLMEQQKRLNRAWGGSRAALCACPLHMQVHVEVEFLAHVEVPPGWGLSGWDYPQSQFRHASCQQWPNSQCAEQGWLGKGVQQLQLLARTNGIFLPTHVAGGMQPQPNGGYDVRVQVSLPLSLVESGSCFCLTLESWHPGVPVSSPPSPTSPLAHATVPGKPQGIPTNNTTNTNSTNNNNSSTSRGNNSNNSNSSTTTTTNNNNSNNKDKDNNCSKVAEFKEGSQNSCAHAHTPEWMCTLGSGRLASPAVLRCARMVAAAPLLLLPCTMCREAAEIESWAQGNMDPSSPPTQNEVQIFVHDLGNWLQFTMAAAASTAASDHSTIARKAFPGHKAGGATHDTDQPTASHKSAAEENVHSSDAQLVRAMACVGRSLLHVAVANSMGMVASLLLCTLQGPPFEAPFAWIVCSGCDLPQAHHSCAHPRSHAGSGGCEINTAGAGSTKAAVTESAGLTSRGDTRSANGQFSFSTHTGDASRANGQLSGSTHTASQPVHAQPVHVQPRAARAPRSAQRAQHEESEQHGETGFGGIGFAERGRCDAIAPFGLDSKSDQLPTCFSFFAFPPERSTPPHTRAPTPNPPHTPSTTAAARSASHTSQRAQSCAHETAANGRSAAHSAGTPSNAVAHSNAAAHSHCAARSNAGPHSNAVTHSVSTTNCSACHASGHGPACTQRQALLNCALLSGQPQMVQAVLWWGCALGGPGWTWRLDEEDARSISPRKIAHAMPQKGVLLPMLDRYPRLIAQPTIPLGHVSRSKGLLQHQRACLQALQVAQQQQAQEQAIMNQHPPAGPSTFDDPAAPLTSKLANRLHHPSPQTSPMANGRHLHPVETPPVQTMPSATQAAESSRSLTPSQ